MVAGTNARKGEEYTPCATCISNIWVCKIMQTYIDYIVCLLEGYCKMLYDYDGL